MGKLVAQNKWLFIGAALCVLISVVIDYLTPLLLAETLDYYLSGQPSTMPAFVNRWVDSWGGPGFMARNLWIVGLALVGLNIVGGGGALRGLENQLQLFVLHRFIAELAQRIPLLRQFLKSHSCTLRF